MCPGADGMQSTGAATRARHHSRHRITQEKGQQVSPLEVMAVKNRLQVYGNVLPEGCATKLHVCVQDLEMGVLGALTDPRLDRGCGSAPRRRIGGTVPGALVEGLGFGLTTDDN